MSRHKRGNDIDRLRERVNAEQSKPWAQTKGSSGPAKEATIFPTGSCFDDALEFISERVTENRSAIDALLLVHGIALIPEDQPEAGKPFAHAWVEEGAEVWQSGILDGERIYFSAPKEEILPKLRVQEATRYAVREAHAENVRTKSYGPWLEKYQGLCK